MKEIMLFFLLFINQFSHSQGDSNIWYFGQNASLDFSSGSPSARVDGQLNTNEGCATISTPEGELLFYTDGITVWNRSHQIMFNGTNLLGHNSSSQSAVIIPKPGDSSKYYIITTPDKGATVGARYSEVDMALDNGLGGITNLKNILIKTPVCEKIAVVKKANNLDYWIVLHEYGNDAFLSYSITEEGFNPTPVISNIGSEIVNDNHTIGYLKFSSDGSKIVSCSVGVGAELFDFNLNSGVLTNVRQIGTEDNYYGAEFSSSGNILYVTGGSPYSNKLYQFDLTQPDINSTQVLLHYTGISESGLGALQLAVDGKIYLSRLNRFYLGVINNPEINGQSCDFELNGVHLGGKISLSGLPQFVQSFLEPIIDVNGLCFGNQTSFQLNTNLSPITAFWDFGDGNTSTEINPIHQYSVSGDYLVNVTFTTTNGSFNKSKLLSITPSPQISNTIPEQNLCGEIGINYSLTQFNETVLGTLSESIYGIAYYHNLSDAEQHVNEISNQTDLSSGENLFYVKVFKKTDVGCHSITTLIVNLFIEPKIYHLDNLMLCQNELNSDSEYFNLTQNTSVILGDQNPSQFKVSYHLSLPEAQSNSNALPTIYQNSTNPQTIFVRVENNQQPTCYVIDSFQIEVNKKPILNKPLDFILCDDDANDGTEVFQLESLKTQILGNQSESEFEILFFETEFAALAINGVLNSNYNNLSNPQTLYFRIHNINNNDCFEIGSFQLEVKSKPELIISETYTICEGVPITINAPTGFTTYNWSTGSTFANTTIDAAGTYSLTVSMDYGDIVCSTTKTIEVENSNIATILGVQTVDWTDSQNNIIIYVEGNGDYEYSLDGINYQDSNQFFGLPSGDYTIFVNDKKECGYTTKEVFLLMYPKFFTPNNDGHNDFWKIKFSETEPNLQVNIFDRYGKIITGFKGNDIGWDGTLNGQNLPSSDYWFVVKRENGKEYKGHFSLKR
jgi:gliding motility-associated-like protein